MNYSDIYYMYQHRKSEDEIHQAFRKVIVDDCDELHEGRSPLHLACHYGDTEAVRILLERDADTNIKDANGSAPIYILGRISAGCVDEEKLKEIALMLIEHGANIPRSARNTTALIEGVRNRHFKMAEAIIESGTRINSTDSNGENVLFGLCAASGDIKRNIRFAKKELDEAIQYHYPESKIEEIRSRIARLEEEDETVYRLARKLVEEEKIDPEDKSNCGKTAWDAAIENKAMKIAAFLSGSDPDIDELSALHGNMDIFQAMYMKDMGALDAILRSSADLQTVCEHRDMYDFEGKSPLACAFSWFDTIQDAPAMILNSGADPNYRFPNEETAFSAWVSKDYFCKDTEVYKGLLDLMKEKGWNPELPVDAEGNTALALSCRHTGYRLGKTAFGWLLKRKADPNVANLSGQTPMMILFGGHKANEKYTPYGWPVGSDDPSEILEKLLEAGADVDKTDNRGNTLLHYVAACCRGSMAQKTIELLLDFKLPDVNAVNNEGKTAMDVAADYNNDNLIRLLLKYS